MLIERTERTPEGAPDRAPAIEAHSTAIAPAPSPRAGAGSRAARILALQQSAGNHAVARMLAAQASVQRNPVEAPADGAPTGAPQRTGQVDAALGIVYAQPDRQSAKVAELPRGTPVPVKGRTGDFWIVDQGFVYFLDVAVLTAGETPAGAPDQPAGATAAKAGWPQVIPDAKPRGGTGLGKRSGHSSAQGDMIVFGKGAGNVPSATYGPPGKREVAEAEPLAPGVTEADVDAAAAAVAGARGNIRQRFMRVTESHQKNADYYGYESTPKLDEGLGANTGRSAERFKARDADWQQTVDASKAYMAWLNAATTKPSQCSEASDMRWRVFRRMMDWEGVPSAVNAFDRANITLGAGFAGSAGGAVQPKGQAQELMGDVLKRSPEAAGLFFAAGLTVLDGEFVVVDPARKWKLRGMDAELYFRANSDLLSLYVNVAQGSFLEDKAEARPRDDPRQAVLDANFATFLNHALAGKGSLGGDVDLAALKVHAAHSGNIAWGEVSGFGSVPELVRFIYSRVSREQADAIVVEPKWRALAPAGGR